MPRVPLIINDFSGGVFRSRNQNAAPANTVRAAWNCRVDEYGDLTKRTGTEKIHDTVLDATSESLFYWERGIGTSPQFISVEGDELKTMAQSTETDWTSRGTMTGFSALTYKPMVAWNTGSTNRVYVTEVSGGTRGLWFWDGASLVEVTEFPGNEPAWMEVYKSRLWINDSDVSGTGNGAGIYACAVNDPSVWDTTSGALYFSVGSTGSTAVTGMKAVGESLLIFKPDSIIRVTGTDSFSLNIDQDSEGVSNQVGCVHGSTIVKFGQEVFFLASEGPYVANEGGIRYIGAPVEQWFRRRQDVAFAFNSYAAAHHPGRREIHIWFTPTPSIASEGRLGTRFESGTNPSSSGGQIGFIWDYVADAWYGPLALTGTSGINSSGNTFNRVTAAASFKYTQTDLLASGESILYAVADSSANGWICDADSPNGFQDYMDRGGGNGESYGATVELPELTFGRPDHVKLFNPSQYISADIDTSTTDADGIQVRTISEISAASTVDVSVSAQSNTTSWPEFRTREFRFQPNLRGKRPVMQVIFNNDGYASLKGLSLTAEIGRRDR